MRAVSAAALASLALDRLSTPLTIGVVTVLILHACAALLLLVGLWTPMAGLLLLALESWRAVSQPGDARWTHILLATLCGGLALLGPGAWSIDARLFGWKRIDIKDRHTRTDIDT